MPVALSLLVKRAYSWQIDIKEIYCLSKIMVGC
jgi:hypothetical protein